ncbi:hypothetical protein LXA43DRAFT_971848 [Ganoderma leucocontextum]|nr:hypothetical protein LXA43DRAFT_971848 [Ganoderma leucocontextum]
MSAVSTPDLSPILGPHTRARRLSARRGSVAAADPWGEHNDVNMNPSRSLTSRLTIVRVPQPEIQEPPRRHGRHGSNASLNSNASGKSDGPGGRLSFAFTSFSPPGGQSGGSGRASSPSGSPRFRPTSPSSSRFPSALPGHSKLNPEQLVNVARSSVNPRSPLPSPGGPLTPAHVHANPISFTPLPDSVYLPFINRPEEVAALIETQPNLRLFALLQQTFPLDARASMGSQYEASKTSSDPKEWAYADLEYWLKRVDRHVAEDAQWVRKSRRCVISHSELIWERVKGALGVPPELDVTQEDGDAPSEPPVTSESLESSPFEPDSPVASDRTGSESELVIEPVFANQTPPVMMEPSGGLGSSLGDLREEDETEGAEEKGEQEQEIQGLRIITSSSAPGFVRDHAMPPVQNSSPLVQPKFASSSSSSSSSKGTDEKDMAYDMLRERGPGLPLFPSNFSQLSLSPTFQPSKRTLSVSGYPPRPAYASPHSIRTGVHRTGSVDANAGRAATMARPEWARHWDPSKHEYAVTTASTGSVSGAE